MIPRTNLWTRHQTTYVVPQNTVSSCWGNAEGSQMSTSLIYTSFWIPVIMKTLQPQVKDLCLTNVRSWMCYFLGDIIQIRRHHCALSWLNHQSFRCEWRLICHRVPQVQWGGRRRGKSQFLTPGPMILVRLPNISSNLWTLILLYITSYLKILFVPQSKHTSFALQRPVG